MFDSIALMMGEVDRLLGGLGQEFVHPLDIEAALFRVFAFYGLTAQQSSYGRTGKLTGEFQLGSRDSLITQATDMMLPSYLEIQQNSSAFDNWLWVPAVDSASLEQARSRGQMRCCFERYDDGFHLRLSYDPGSIVHRLRYYSDPVIPDGKNDPSPIAERFTPLLTSAAVPYVASTALSRSAALAAEDEKAGLTNEQLAAISAAVGLAQNEVAQWKPLWDAEIKNNRNPIGRDRNPILSRGTGPRRTYNG